MKYDYKHVGIYVDDKHNMILVPSGKSQKWGGAIIGINAISEIKAPYTEEQIEEELIKAMDRCYSLAPDDSLKESVLEKYLGIRGFSKACKGRKLIEFSWSAKDGFMVIPTRKVKGQGYQDIQDLMVFLGKKIQKGELAKAVKHAIDVSETF